MTGEMEREKAYMFNLLSIASKVRWEFLCMSALFGFSCFSVSARIRGCCDAR